MIVWIASWPRSGNTLVRLILRDMYGIDSYSTHEEPELEPIFGKRITENNVTPDTYIGLRDDPKETFFVKTHAYIPDGMPCIYLIRDARDAMLSLSKIYRTDIINIITGQGFDYPGWSSHYWAWNAKKRGKCIYIKFEEFIQDIPGFADQIGQWLHIRKTHDYKDAFEENRKRCPLIFNTRGESHKNEMPDSVLELFWRIHGSAMKDAGYAE
jgi:hypothetical protein